jgi:hypothetical protein
MSPDNELLSCVSDRHYGRTSLARLPAPGPAPLCPAPGTAVIIISVRWLLAGGYYAKGAGNHCCDRPARRQRRHAGCSSSGPPRAAEWVT